MLAALAALLVVVVAACWAVIALLGALPGDAASAAEVREQRLGWIVLAAAQALDWVGRPVPDAIIVAALAAWTWRRIGQRHAMLLVGAMGVAAVTWLLKEIVNRPRPIGAAQGGASFPLAATPR